MNILELVSTDWANTNCGCKADALYLNGAFEERDRNDKLEKNEANIMVFMF